MTSPKMVYIASPLHSLGATPERVNIDARLCNILGDSGIQYQNRTVPVWAPPGPKIYCVGPWMLQEETVNRRISVAAGVSVVVRGTICDTAMRQDLDDPHAVPNT